MIPSIDNAIQLVVTGGCAIIALNYALKVRMREWFLLALFYFTFFLGDLYWQLYIVFYDGASPEFYISEFGWYTSYLFLLILLVYINTESNKKWRYRFDPLFMLIPAFTIGMCIFYMQWGDFLSNMITAVLMMGLIWHAFYGLKVLRGRPEQEKGRRMLFLVTLLFCGTEYALWTSSCFWMGETVLNIYYWFDMMLSVSFVLFLPALRKAVGR